MVIQLIFQRYKLPPLVIWSHMDVRKIAASLYLIQINFKFPGFGFLNPMEVLLIDQVVCSIISLLRSMACHHIAFIWSRYQFTYIE